jgi:transcriptional regulator with XRE-family HTH domain
MEKYLEKAQRLNEVYKFVFSNFDIKSQKDFADFLKVQRTGLSAAMNGSKANLTKNLFIKICAAFPGVFNLDYLLTGKGSLLAEETEHNDAFFRSMEAIDPSSFINAIIAAKDETIAAIREQLETKEQTISLLRQQIDILRQQLAEGSHHTTPMVAEEITKQETKK